MKTITKLTDAALDVAVLKDGVRPAMTRPYSHTDGYTYATDGHILLRIPNEKCNTFELVKDYKFPAAWTLFDSIRMEYTEPKGYLCKAQMVDLKKDAAIADYYIDAKIYRRIQYITRLLGVESWLVTPSSRGLLLTCEDVTVLVCPLLESKGYQTISLVEMAESKMDVNSALQFLPVYLKQMQEETEAENRKNERMKCIYTFSIAKYATMYVKASNVVEAKRIAKRHCNDIDDWDFDDVEVDSWDNIPEKPSDDMNDIYTDDGVKTYNEVMDILNEEEDEA